MEFRGTYLFVQVYLSVHYIKAFAFHKHILSFILQAICRLTYDTKSGTDRGTAYYYRNLLDSKDVKGEVKNAYRAYRLLYYKIFDGICCTLFLQHFGMTNAQSKIPMPPEWDTLSVDQRIQWLNNICRVIVQKWFFENGDPLQEIREILSDPNHVENYWVSNETEGRFKCHYCDTTYAFVGSLKTHESKIHGHTVSPSAKRKDSCTEDELYNNILLLFKLTALHRNLDTAVDMGDGHRSVRSAKYETPIYHRTNKIKYLI